MTTLSGNCVVPPAGPEEPCLSEAGACRDDGAVPTCELVADVDDGEVLGPEQCDPERVGLQVVDDSSRSHTERAREIARVDCPGQVDGLGTAVPHRPGDRKTGG